MAKTAWTPATTAAQSGSGGTWGSTNDARSPDGLLANCDMIGADALTNQLTLGGFGIVLPPHATVDGIEIRVTWYQSGDAQQHTLTFSDGSSTSNNLATGTSIPTSPPVAQTFGSASEAGGETLTPDYISSLEVNLITQNDAVGNASIFVDAVEVRVHFTHGPTSGTVDLAVAASGGDADEVEDSTGFSYTGSTLSHRFGAGTASTRLGMLFAGATIPRDHFVDAARLKPVLLSGSAIDGTIKVASDVTPDDFATEQDVVGRALFTTGQAWSDSGLAAGEITSPDIAAVLQQAVDDAAWRYNASLVLALVPTTSGSDTTTTLRAYDGDADDAARLSIDWSDHATHVYRIATGVDDAYEPASETVTATGDLTVPAGGFVGLRFQGVKSPAGATLLSAELSVVWKSGGTAFDCNIKGDKSEDSAHFFPYSAGGAEISSRTMHTTPVVRWTETMGSVQRYTSPDLTSLVNTMMAASEWSDGEPLTFILDELLHDGYATEPVLYSFESGEASGYEAILTLEWSIPTTVEMTPAAVAASSPPATPDMSLIIGVEPSSVAAASPSASASVGVDSSAQPAAITTTPAPTAPAFISTVAATVGGVQLGNTNTTIAVEANLTNVIAAVDVCSGTADLSIGADLVDTPGAIVVSTASPQLAGGADVSQHAAALAVSAPSPFVDHSAIILQQPAGLDLAIDTSEPTVAAISLSPDTSIDLARNPIVTTVGTDVPQNVSALATTGVPAGVAPGLSVNATPHNIAASGLPVSPSIETIHLPPPAAATISRGPAPAALGIDVELQLAATSLSSSPIIAVPGATVSTVPAAGVLGGQLHEASIETNMRSNPTAVSVGGNPSTQAQGMDVEAQVAATSLSSSPIIAVPGATVSAVPAAGVLGGQLHEASIETNMRSNPTAVSVGGNPSTQAQGMDVEAQVAATSLSSSPIITVPGATVSTVPAAGVLGGQLHEASIETSMQSNATAVSVGGNPSTQAQGMDVELQLAATSLSSLPIITAPGSTVTTVPAAGVLGGQLDVAIETTMQSNPTAVSIASPATSISVGTDLLSNPIAATVEAIATIALPGTSVVHAPAAAALSSPPGDVSKQAFAKLVPVAVQVGRNAIVAGLGYDLAVLPGSLTVSAQANIAAGVRVDGLPVAVSASGSTTATVGVTVQPAPIGISPSGHPMALDISGAIQSPPAAVALAAPDTLESGSAVVSTLPSGMEVSLLPPHGIGAVHILGHDLFYTLPDSRLRYTLEAARLRYTLPSEAGSMATCKQTWTKSVSETPDIAVDCANQLKDLETITSIDSVTVSSPDDLTITGLQVNTVVSEEPGYPDGQIGQVIICFVAGGTSGTSYALTFLYQTSEGQTREAVAKLVVT